MSFKKNILCIGAGYVGGPTMAIFALKCPEYKITVCDINEERIKAWNSDNLPIYEPGLEEIVRKRRGKNLFFNTKLSEEIRQADIIFVSVNTPTKTFGVGSGKAADLQYIENVARMIYEHSEHDKIVVEKSTLPVRTAEAILSILNSKNNKNIRFDIVSNPEFLSEGTAVGDMLNPDRILIGSEQTSYGVKASQAVSAIYEHWISKDKIITTSLWSSELTKLVANAFLAQKISSINSISALCEKTGANIDEVAEAVGRDSRIGPKFLKASVGFGGSCFQKDILNLVYIAESYGLREVAEYWENVIKMNDYQENRFADKMVKVMFSTITNKRIALFGFAFKTDTGDTRYSPAIQVAKRLMEEKANLVITDPKALENAKKDLADYTGKVIFEQDPYKAANGAHAIAIITGWKEYKNLDYKKIYDSMSKPAFIFDGCRIVDPEMLSKIGYKILSVGCGE